MKRVAWFTDSTTASFTTDGDNFVIPIEVIIDGVSYKDCEEGVHKLRRFIENPLYKK